MLHKTSSKGRADALIAWIRDYAAARIDSRLADERRCFPPHIFLDLGSQGFFGMHISCKHGGLGLDVYDMLRVIEQVAAIDLTLTTILIEGIQSAHTLEKYASKDLKAKYLVPLAQGQILMAGAMTESAAGSNPRAMQATAVPDGQGGWLLKGSKRWVGMGSWASLIAVYVQQMDAENNWLGMSGFLVPQGATGLRIGPEAPTMGIRGIAKHTIYLDDVMVRPEQLLGKPGEGMEIAQDNMMYIRLCLAAANVGAMKRSAQLMYRYAKRRTIATGQLLENPVTLVHLSELTTAIHAIEHFVYLVGSLLDKQAATVPEELLVIAKILGSEYLGWAVDKLVQTLGARGYEESSGVSQLFRDARTFRIFEGPTEALNMYVGSRVLASNPLLQHFICDTLNQNGLFVEIKQAIENANGYCQVHKRGLFDKPFSVNYLAQALAGEIVSYGLLLAVMEYSTQQDSSKNNKRSAAWARGKFNDVVQKSLTFTCAEASLVSPAKLEKLVTGYTKTIGDIEQTRISDGILVDELLTRTPILEGIPDHYPLQQNGFSGSATEQQRLLQEWSRIKEAPYEDILVHALFERQVRQSPESLAVVYQDQKMTYRELNIRANRLAHYLKKQGVLSDTPVAIYLERSLDMVVSVLGILKAGAAYLPLDCHYPEERLTFMLQDAGAQIVLTQSSLAHRLPLVDKHVLLLDQLTSLLAEPEDNLENLCTTDSLAYIIYTSGSTGKPKGVMLPHKPLSNLLNWQQSKIGGKRTILQFTTLSFDMSFLEIFSALCGGGTLTLISEHDRLDLASFAKIIKHHAVEQVMLPVPFFKQLAAAKLDKHYFKTLKEIITAGEQLTINDSVREFFDQLNGCRLLNYYGPSETHVITAYELPENSASWPTHPPIGSAIANAKALILDENLHPMPIGETGELYLGGISLARGYKNRDKLTHEKFIADRWCHKTNSRLYRTGDFARYLPDGNIEFLGRRDSQVKIRGFRIAPQEIESHLIEHPGIKEAVVVSKADAGLEKHLEAFIVTHAPVDEAYINDIHAFLRKRLPPHMLPSILNPIEAMPLTPTGKIDRSAVEKMESLGLWFASRNIIKPNTQTEKIVVAILEDFFGLSVSITDSFKSIGGNSLLAMQVVALLYKQLAVDIPAYAILSDPTIADIAQRIDLLKSQKSITLAQGS